MLFVLNNIPLSKTIWPLWFFVCTIMSVYVSSSASPQCHVLSSDANKVDIRLTGYSIHSVTAAGRVNCISICFEVTPCMSVNFRPDTNECQLNTANSSMVNSTDLGQEEGTLLLDIHLWPYTPVGVCSTKPCRTNQRCMHAVDGYSCVTTDCPTNVIPPQHGSYAFSGFSLGSTMALSCDAGYSPYPDGTESITCGVEGRWETSGITCKVDTIHKTCAAQSHCKEAGSRCLAHRCFCEPLHEYIRAERACIKACNAYSKDNRYSLLIGSMKIPGFDLNSGVFGTGQLVSSASECLAFCSHNYGDNAPVYELVFNLFATTCYCGSITWTEARAAGLTAYSGNTQVYQRGCMMMP